MDEFYAGRCKTILLYPGAQKSWDEAELLVPPGKKGKPSNEPAQFRARIKRYADVGKLRSPDHMNSEGKGCFVIKSNCGLRAWGWPLHYKNKPVFIITHVVMKKSQKADPTDLAWTVAIKEHIEKEQKEEETK